MIFLELNLNDWETVTSFGFDESDEILSLLKQKAPHIIWRISIIESEVGNEVYGYCNLDVPVAQEEEAKELFYLIMDGEDPNEYEFTGNKSKLYYQVIEMLDDDMILASSVEEFLNALKQTNKVLNDLVNEDSINSCVRLYHCLLKLNSLFLCLPSGHPYIHIDSAGPHRDIKPYNLEQNFNEIAEKVYYIIHDCIEFTESAKYENYPETWSSIVYEWEYIFNTNIVEQLMNEIRYAMCSEYIKKGYRFVKLIF